MARRFNGAAPLWAPRGVRTRVSKKSDTRCGTDLIALLRAFTPEYAQVDSKGRAMEDPWDDCPLCMSPIRPGDPTASYEDGTPLHDWCARGDGRPLQSLPEAPDRPTPNRLSVAIRAATRDAVDFCRREAALVAIVLTAVSILIAVIGLFL